MKQVPKVNEQVTKKYARKTLKDYRKWQRKVETSAFNMRSSRFKESLSRDEADWDDDGMLDYINAKIEREAILEALVKLSKRSREILFLSYCDQEYHTIYEIGILLNYSEKSIDRLKSIALLEFAEAYSHRKLEVFV